MCRPAGNHHVIELGIGERRLDQSKGLLQTASDTVANDSVANLARYRETNAGNRWGRLRLDTWGWHCCDVGFDARTTVQQTAGVVTRSLASLDDEPRRCHPDAAAHTPKFGGNLERVELHLRPPLDRGAHRPLPTPSIRPAIAPGQCSGKALTPTSACGPWRGDGRGPACHRPSTCACGSRGDVCARAGLAGRSFSRRVLRRSRGRMPATVSVRDWRAKGGPILHREQGTAARTCDPRNPLAPRSQPAPPTPTIPAQAYLDEAAYKVALASRQRKACESTAAAVLRCRPTCG